MDFLPDIDTFNVWMVHYGSFAFFCLLALGVIALPIPDETLMVLAGVFMKKGELPIESTLAAAYLGSMCGITISYLIGRCAGSPLIHRYGKYVGITEAKLRTVHNWFERFGKWTLSFGYFIPGVRHLTGLAAGIAELEYLRFALFAYTGAFIWASFFLSIGYFLGECLGYCRQVLDLISEKVLIVEVIVTVIALVGIYFLARRHINK